MQSWSFREQKEYKSCHRIFIWVFMESIFESSKVNFDIIEVREVERSFGLEGEDEEEGHD